MGHRKRSQPRSVSLGTVIVTPPLFVVGIRGYSKDNYGLQAAFDIYAKDLPKHFSRLLKLKTEGSNLEKVEKHLGNIQEIDAVAITKGKGWEGPITRWGVKKKQHKSRKSVREVGSLGPISPASIMYTVPRAGQRGF